MRFKVLSGALAAVAAAMPAVAADPFDPRLAVPAVMYFVSIPLDARSRKEREPWLGMKLQGKREYHALHLDTRMLSFVGGGLDAKVLLAGAVAIGGALAVGGGGGGGGSSEPAQPAPQQQATSTPSASGGSTSTPCPPTPCPKK
jgi:hypothetical protein